MEAGTEFCKVLADIAQKTLIIELCFMTLCSDLWHHDFLVLSRGYAGPKSGLVRTVAKLLYI